MNEPLIRLRNVDKSFRSVGETVLAIGGVSLDVFAGDFIAVVGPSGAGKSTLLNILGLLETPSAGTYELHGTDLSSLTERQRDDRRASEFGFIFQSSYVLPRESVARNVVLSLNALGVSRRRQAIRAFELLSEFGLLHRANQRGAVLSGGERQRLAIARAMSAFPNVLLADEPTGNLDSGNAALVVRALGDLNSAGVTVIIITHDESVAAVARRRVRILDGHLSEDPTRSHAHAAISGQKSAQESIFKDRTFQTRLENLLSGSLSSVASRLGQVGFLIFAFVIGAGGLVAAVDLSSSAASQIAGRLSQAALDEVQVNIPRTWDSHQISLASREIAGLRGVLGVGRQTEVAPGDAQVSSLPNPSANGVFPGRVVGESESLARLDGVSITPVSARYLLDSTSPVAFLGKRAAATLGIATVGPGKAIWVLGTRVPVVGIVSGAKRDGSFDDAVLLSSSFAETLPGTTPKLIVRTKPGFPAALSQAIPLKIAPGSPASVNIDTVADLRHLALGVNADFSVFIAAISAAILLLASFSAGATMFLNVVTRTPEIALRRAVGASRRNIRMLFLAEGGVLGLAGGAAGAVVGSAATVIFCATQGWSVNLSPWAVPAAVLAGTLTGILAAILPAARAARIDPAEAIRS